MVSTRDSGRRPGETPRAVDCGQHRGQRPTARSLLPPCPWPRAPNPSSGFSTQASGQLAPLGGLEWGTGRDRGSEVPPNTDGRMWGVSSPCFAGPCGQARQASPGRTQMLGLPEGLQPAASRRAGLALGPDASNLRLSLVRTKAPSHRASCFRPSVRRSRLFFPRLPLPPPSGSPTVRRTHSASSAPKRVHVY